MDHQIKFMIGMESSKFQTEKQKEIMIWVLIQIVFL